MAKPNLGPVFRQMADLMKSNGDKIRKEIDKLRQKIRDRLSEKARNRFDKQWDKAKDTKGQKRAAIVMLGRVTDDIIDVGDQIDPSYAAAEQELWALVELLRALESIEGMEQHFSDLAKSFGA